MARKVIDWEAIEREYRAGQLSISEIARQHDISKQAILKKAKKDGWERDLSEQVRTKVNARLVTGDVTEKLPVTTRETVEVAAARGVEVVRSHRKYLGRLLHIAGTFMTDLEKDCEQEKPELKMGYKEKAEILKATTQAIAKAIPLERQAFNLDEKATGDNKNEISGKLIIEKQRVAVSERLKNNPDLAESIKNAIHQRTK